MQKASLAPAQQSVATAVGEERRITGLDGLRGVASLMVVVSHYFGEVPHGIKYVMFGWIAVCIFFVLSGYLIGKLILEKSKYGNFFGVFYIRRFLRIIPAYIVTIIVVQVLLNLLPGKWTDAAVRYPTWSYLTFVQGLFMSSTGSIGAHWLAPTWTLAVEEHFYLIAPAAIVFTPRRALPWVLWLTVAGAVAFRAAVYFGGFRYEAFTLYMLPGSADLLALGVLGAVAVTSYSPATWKKLDPLIIWLPTVAACLILFCKITDERLNFTLLKCLSAIGCLGLILSIVRVPTFARRFQYKTLRFLGDNAYCTYLTHLPVLGLMHGFILGARPDLRSPAQWAVTVAALPISLVVGWGMTKLIEEPLTRYGRNWRWGDTYVIGAPAARSSGATALSSPPKS